MIPLAFASAYKQLTGVEKAFVDGYVAQVEREAARAGERISNALYRAIPPEVMEASRGLLDRPLVRAAITERINQIAADSELTVQRVIKELMAVAFSSLGDYMEIYEDGTFAGFDMAKATPEQLAAIQSFEIDENMRGGRKYKIRLHSKLEGIKMLAEYMGLLNKDNPHWRSEIARPVDTVALPAGISVQAAADEYSRLING